MDSVRPLSIHRSSRERYNADCNAGASVTREAQEIVERLARQLSENLEVVAPGSELEREVMCRTLEPVAELIEAAQGVMELIDQGKLVRDTSGDLESDWAIKQIPMVRTLAAFQSALTVLRDAAGHSK